MIDDTRLELEAENLALRREIERLRARPSSSQPDPAAVTDERESRQALQADRSFLKTLVSNLPGMVYRCRNDPDWTMTFLSQACHDVTGYEPADLQAGGVTSFGSLVHPDDRDWLWSKCQTNLERREPCTNEYRIIRRDGSEAWVWERARGIYDGDGRLLHIEGFVLDITQRKTLEEQLLQSQKLESIGRLAGGIAHDFNNLLTAILGAAELLEIEATTGPPNPDRLRAIRTAGERARDLTRQLLAFARKQSPQLRSLDLSAVIASSHELLRRLLREDIALELQLAPGLWPIEADTVQIEQILLNLAANARDAMPAGGQFEMATTNRAVAGPDATHPNLPPGDWVLLRISDTGTGMSPETRRQAFEPFFTTKPIGEGTGLGLATVHGIVAQGGGQIRIESLPGVGTTFYLYFPRSTRPAPVADLKSDAAAAPPLARGSELILVVEDDDAVREITTQCLELGGYRVLQAASGQEALAIAQQIAEPLALLVTDVVMPGMSGPQVAAAFLVLQPGLPVLYTSGYTRENATQLGLVDDRVELLPKPFSLRVLLSRVRALIDQRRAD